MTLRLTTVDRFAPEATALRRHFEGRFADPRRATTDRFVWDLWHVPGQYTALRTPAWTFFPKKTYEAFHQRLVWWGRRTLGCHDVSPPWLSCYVNGCEQRLHGDLPHGQFAWVFSLTKWNERNFRGGETFVLTEEALDFWARFESVRSVEEPELIEEIEPHFNRLTVFDPRLPHGVRRVDGSMDPREGRLVVHGWFVQPRPFVEGPLALKQVEGLIDAVTDTLTPTLARGVPLAGLMSLGLKVSAAGIVTKAEILADTTRSPEDLSSLRRDVLKRCRAFRFGKQRGPSRITLPLVFER